MEFSNAACWSAFSLDVVGSSNNAAAAARLARPSILKKKKCLAVASSLLWGVDWWLLLVVGKKSKSTHTTINFVVVLFKNLKKFFFKLKKNGYIFFLCHETVCFLLSSIFHFKTANLKFWHPYGRRRRTYSKAWLQRFLGPHKSSMGESWPCPVDNVCILCFILQNANILFYIHAVAVACMYINNGFDSFVYVGPNH